MGEMDGRVAIVTGAAGGVGRAVARCLLSDGAKVLLCDRGVSPDGKGGSDEPVHDVRDAFLAEGFDVEANSVGVASEADAEALVSQAVSKWGRLDALVHAAGFLRDKTLGKMDEEAWRSVVDVHLTTSYQLARAAARAMLSRGNGGQIVFTTSPAAFLGNPGQSNFGAATAGVYGLTRTLAIELQKHRIFVNAVAPIAKTRLTEGLPMFANVGTLTPDHAAPAYQFFASGRSGDRTGHVLGVCGSQVFSYKLVQTSGRFKDGDGAFTADEIRDHWDSIVRA